MVPTLLWILGPGITELILQTHLKITVKSVDTVIKVDGNDNEKLDDVQDVTIMLDGFTGTPTKDDFMF